jgi:hypothetical protein
MSESSGPGGRKAARAFFFLLAAGCSGGGGLREGEPALGPDGEVVVLLSAEETRDAQRLSSEELKRHLTVFVRGQRENPLFGDHRLDGRRLVFVPRYPLRPGMTYMAAFESPRQWNGSGLQFVIERSFEIPAPPAAPPARVVRVTPSRDTLPENQLKFYLYFSAPMARGEAYDRVHLEANGKKVEHPFLELGEELWDHTGSRLTLFFDPGRIKRELKPREEIGPSLEEGKSYVLTVDREWHDAEGRPLASGFRKAFKAVGPDEKQPDPARWTLTAPGAGTRDPLVVVFDEPLDHAMLGRVLEVAGVPGRIEIDREETRWRLHPEKPWTAGRHALQVDTLLEDLAGNSLAKPFEVDVFRPIERRVVSKTITLPFDVR